MTDDVTLWHGDCLDLMARIPDGGVDAIITDPPYPCIDREYGKLTEAAWHELMRGVVAHARRVLKPKGSAVFVLQPNSEKVGRMRPWLWEFMAWTAREWNQVQDAWWWNYAAVPVNCSAKIGLMRPSVKACVWLGEPDCYRDQSEVLWKASESFAKTLSRPRTGVRQSPSGSDVVDDNMAKSVIKRGGVTPFNLYPCPNSDNRHSAGAHGHGAGTPQALCDWWARYIVPPSGTVLDPFMGSGTTGIAALRRGHKYIGIEKFDKYFPIAQKRIADERAKTALLTGAHADA